MLSGVLCYVFGVMRCAVRCDIGCVLCCVMCIVICVVLCVVLCVVYCVLCCVVCYTVLCVALHCVLISCCNQPSPPKRFGGHKQLQIHCNRLCVCQPF